MSARKAYISSLGTTGLLVAAALAMLVVVGALVAFDRWPSQAIAEAESVPIAGDSANVSHRAGGPASLGRAGRAARSSGLTASRSRAVLRKAAARAGRVESTVPAAGTPVVDEQVVSDLPAPDSAPDGPAPAAPAQPATAQAPASAPHTPSTDAPVITVPPTSLVPGADDSLADAASGLGDTRAVLSQTVHGTGTTATGAVHTLLGGK